MHSICHTVAMALSEASVKVVAIIFPLLLAACAETPSTGGAVDRSMQIYTERSALFGPEQSVPEPQQLFQLTPSQQAQFVEFYQQQKRSDSYSDDIIFDFLSQNLSRFDYHYDTYTAHEAWEKLQGNCLSLAILTQALADLIGVQAKYELVDATPVFEKQKNFLRGNDKKHRPTHCK